jgi:hypothetical protein
MLKEAALVTVSCVLFVQMGLSHAIQERMGFRSEILSCPRCCTFWSVLAYLILSGRGVLAAVAASFLSSYSAMWLSLLYDALARLYNACYDAISEPDSASDAEAPAHEASADSDALS